MNEIPVASQALMVVMFLWVILVVGPLTRLAAFIRHPLDSASRQAWEEQLHANWRRRSDERRRRRQD